MRDETEIREAARQAKTRMEECEEHTTEEGAYGGADIVQSLAQGSWEALLWVLEEDDGHVTGYGSE